MRVKNLVIFSILTSVLFVAQVGLSFLPNIELVSLLIIVYTKLYGKKVFPIIYTFVFLEGVFYGFGLWWITYLYVWSILALAVLWMKKVDSALAWAIVSGAYGLCYGLLCAIPYFVGGGVGGGLAYWVSGIPFDVAHCIGNSIVCLTLYRPVYAILKQLVKESRNSV